MIKLDLSSKELGDKLSLRGDSVHGKSGQ